MIPALLKKYLEMKRLLLPLPGALALPNAVNSVNAEKLVYLQEPVMYLTYLPWIAKNFAKACQEFINKESWTGENANWGNFLIFASELNSKEMKTYYYHLVNKCSADMKSPVIFNKSR